MNEGIENRNEEIIAEKIEKLKELVESLSGTGNDVQPINDILVTCDDLLYRIERMESSWFVSVNEYGPDDSFTRVYTPLGFMTRRQAMERCESLSEDGGYSSNDLKSVPKETFDMYVELAFWYSLLELYSYGPFGARDGIVDIGQVNSKIEKLRNELGLIGRWETVSTEFPLPR